MERGSLPGGGSGHVEEPPCSEADRPSDGTFSSMLVSVVGGSAAACTNSSSAAAERTPSSKEKTDAFSMFFSEESRCGGAAGTGQQMKKNSGEQPVEEVNGPRILHCATGAASHPARNMRASDGWCPPGAVLTEEAATAPNVTREGANGSGGEAVNNSAARTERRREAFVGATGRGSCTPHVAKGKISGLNAIEASKDAVSALDFDGRPPVHSATNDTAPTEHIIGAPGIPELSIGQLVSEELEFESATSKQQPPEQCQQSSQDSSQIRGRSLRASMGNKYILVDVHDTQSQFDTRPQGRRDEFKERRSDVLATAICLPADETMEENDQSFVPGSRASVCTVGKGSNSDPRDAAHVLSADPGKGRLIQSSRSEATPHDTGEICFNFPPTQVQHSRRNSAGNAQTDSGAGDDHLLQGQIEDHSEDNFTRLRELRQFTLELLYAVSLLRPFGRKGRFSGDPAGSISQGEPEADNQERVHSFTTGSQLTSPLQCTRGEREKGYAVAPFVASVERRDASQAEKAKCGFLMHGASASGKMPFRRNRSSGSFDDVAALKRRITEAVSLCKGERTCNRLFTAAVRDAKGHFPGEDENVFSEEKRAEEVAASVALAAVASADRRPQHNSFEVLAEKIVAAKTINEVAVYLCGPFGPLLHLLQGHMEQNRLQPAGKFKMEIGSKRTGVGIDDFGVSQMERQALPRDPDIGLPAERRFSCGAHADEVVDGVNAVLQVLMEVDQLAADTALDSVCKLLFPSCSEQKELDSSPTHASTVFMEAIRESDPVGQAEDRRASNHMQQHQKNELTSAQCSSLSGADVPWELAASFSSLAGAGSAPSWEEGREREAGRQCRSGDEKESIHWKASKRGGVLSTSLALEDEQNLEAGENRNEIQTEADIRGGGRVSVDKLIPNDGFILPITSNSGVASLSEGEEQFDSVVSSSTAFALRAAHSQHGVESTDATESLLRACRASCAEGDVSQVVQDPFARQPREQEMLKEGEEYISSQSGSIESDDPLSSRTAWLAAQLSTPLDHLGGESTQETGDDRSGNGSKEVMHILETLERAVLQPPAASNTGSSATAGTAKELLTENSDEPPAWETGVQLVLRMLREQEEQLSASEFAVAPSEDRGLSARERNPKRRAIFHEDTAKQAVCQNVLSEKSQLRPSVCGGRQEGYNAQEHTEGTVALHRGAVASSTGPSNAAGDHESRSQTDEKRRTITAEHAATFRRSAAAAAVERAATAVAQQGAIAAVEHARLDNAELMEKMRDLAGPPQAELPGPISAPSTELAVSSCRALRRAVEYVEPSKNDEENLAEVSGDMFAELDDEGLDTLVCQLLKIAERPMEHPRRQQNREERLMGLLRDMQGPGQEAFTQRSEHDLNSNRALQPKRSLQHEAYPPSVQQQAQWKEMVAKGQIVRRGSTGDVTDVSRHSFLQKETDTRGTSPSRAFRESYAPRGRAHYVGEPHVHAVSSFLRTTEIVHREEKLLPSQVSPARLNPPGVSTTITSWPLRRPSGSSGSRRLSLNPTASTGDGFSSPADSPLSTWGLYVGDTPRQSDARSFGPSRRRSSVKRSPWRSCEPYGSSASTMVASPGAHSTQSAGSSSLTCSPFSLLPASAIAVLPPSEVTPELRLEGIGDGNAPGHSGHDRLVGGGRVSRVEAFAGDSSALHRDPCLHPSSSRRAECRQRRFSAEEVNLPSGLLPATVSGADRSSTLSLYSSNASPKKISGARAISRKTVTGLEGVHQRDLAADSFHAQLRALEFFDISASARAHLLAEGASPSAPLTRGLSSCTPTAPVANEAERLAKRKQEQGAPTIGRTQASASVKAAQEGSLKFLGGGANPFSASSRAEGSQGSLKAAIPIKVEHSHLLLPCSLSSAVVRSTIESGPSAGPAAVVHASELSKSHLREATRFAFDTPSRSAGQRSRIERPDQGLESTEIWGSRSGLAKEDGSTTVSRGRGDPGQHLSDAVPRLTLGQPWTRASAGCGGSGGRQQQQEILLGGKDFWRKGRGTENSGDLRRPPYAGGERQDEKSSTRQYESLLSSPLFTRSTPTGVQKEPAVAGCVGTGGADCVCGGALCLYRSAVSGVVYDKSGQKWTARWNEDGRQHKRTFAAAKYGFITAKLKAEACRVEARERTARTKHEALQRQQESFAHRFGLVSTARPTSTSGHSHVCTETGSDAAAAARTVDDQKHVQS